MRIEDRALVLESRDETVRLVAVGPDHFRARADQEVRCIREHGRVAYLFAGLRLLLKVDASLL